MSVPIYKREKDKFKARKASKCILRMTINTLSNPKTADKKYRRLLWMTIFDPTYEIQCCIDDASAIYVGTDASKLEARNELHQKAISLTQRVISALDFNYSIMHIKQAKLVRWVGLLELLKNMLTNLKKSDTRVFKDKMSRNIVEDELSLPDLPEDTGTPADIAAAAKATGIFSD